MTNYQEIKKELFQECTLFVDKRLETIEQGITSCKKALESETKSSAGDKHETGRAMVQLEMEKGSQQLAVVCQMKTQLSKISLNKSDSVRLGSLVITNKLNYFIAVSTGKITVQGKDYYAISFHSPIGKLLLGKQQGATIELNGTEIGIIRIY